MDKYESLRNIPALAALSALGVDISVFKKRINKPEWFGKCPIHQSKTNNTCFSVHQDGRFSCFSCSAKGKGMLDLVKLARQCSFSEAVAFLEPLVGKEPPDMKKEPVEAPSVSDGVLKPYTGKYEKFQVPCPWLEERIPDPAIREKYGVFCYDNPARKSAYSGRVMIPVRDINGVLYGYLGRRPPSSAATPSTEKPQDQNEPKYLFPTSLPKSHFLFGAYELRQHLASISPLPSSRYAHVYLLESPFAVMKFASLNLAALSPFGWSVSEEQIEILSALTKAVSYLPDTDKAGQQSAGVVQALARRILVYSPHLPDGVDDPETMQLEHILALTR